MIEPQKRPLNSLPVIISKNVWIGESVSILPGVRIGKASIIGANSVVTKDIPDYSIAAGNPAKVIKKYNFATRCWERI
jgi:lipopolysaccharide O-acetyltransferase